MHEGQEKFLNFILDNVEESKKEDAKELLAESFAKQADGTFNQEYLGEFIQKMLGMIKPENVEKVKAIMVQFKERHKNI